MTPEDATLILGAAGRAWPQAGFKPETLALYMKRLERFDARAGWEALDALIDTCKYFPSIAEMVNELRVAQRRHQPAPLDRSDLPRLEAGPGDRVASKEVAARWIAQIREQLAAMKTKTDAALAPATTPRRYAPTVTKSASSRRRYDQTYFEGAGKPDSDGLWTPPRRPRKR